MKSGLLSLLILLCCYSVFGQSKKFPDLDPETESVYRTNYKWELPALGAIIATNVYGIDRLRQKPRLTAEEINALNPDDIAPIDRWGLRQVSADRDESEGVSDLIFNASAALPFTLFLGKKYRKDWFNITVIYLEAQMLAGNFYAWGPIGPTFIDRLRPVAYYTDVEEGARGSGNNKNSFFSGHVSNTAVGTYYFAKVLSDYNPQWSGWQRALVFGAATAPPAVVAVLRVKALKHFPTDTVVGLGVGAAFGILTPHLHKVWARNHRSRLSVGGSAGGGVGGAGLVLTF